MPFDGVDLLDTEPLRKIDKIIDLLSDPNKWCKGKIRSHDGRYCIRGAVMSAGATDMLEPAILQAIGEIEVAGRRFRRIESFNDYPDTTHEQVLTALDHTRDSLIAAERQRQLKAARAALPFWKRWSKTARIAIVAGAKWA